MTGRRIAVIGSGVSGLTAGDVLSRTDQVTLFEAGGCLGGHLRMLTEVPRLHRTRGFIPLPQKRRAAGAAPPERA